MAGGHYILLLLAILTWMTGAVWLVGGLKFAASLASTGKAVETTYLVRVVALRTFGIFLAGVQFIVLYGSFDLKRLTFWPLIIGLAFLVGSRVYTAVLRRRGKLSLS